MDENKKIEESALALSAKAKATLVVNQEGYDCACAMLRDLATLDRRIVEHHSPIKDAAHKAHAAACAAEKKLRDPVREAVGILKRAIGSWEQEQEQKRLQAQRQAEAIRAKAEEEARLALAVEAEQHGAAEETVEEILETPMVAPPVVVAPTFQRAAGVSTQQRWTVEVVDMRALCRAIADGKASPELVEPNMTALNQIARAMKQTMNIPGVRAVPMVSVAVRKAV
jgi:hypothetical protein